MDPEQRKKVVLMVYLLMEWGCVLEKTFQQAVAEARDPAEWYPHEQLQARAETLVNDLLSS